MAPEAAACRLLCLVREQQRRRLMRCLRQKLFTLMQGDMLNADGRIGQGSGRTSDLPQPGVEPATRLHACKSQDLCRNGCKQPCRIMNVDANEVCAGQIRRAVFPKRAISQGFAWHSSATSAHGTDSVVRRQNDP